VYELGGGSRGEPRGTCHVTDGDPVTNESRRARARRQVARFGPQVARFASVATLTQGLAMVAGLIVVRAMDKEQYALYGIAVAAIGASAVLSDSGITSTMISSAGRSARQGLSIAAAFDVAMRTRRKLLLFVMPPIVALNAYLLYQNGASVTETAVVLSLVIAAVVPEINSSLYRVVLQIGDAVTAIQWIQFGVAVTRLLILVALWLVPVSSLLPFLAVQAAISLAQLWLFHRAARPILATGAVVGDEDARPYVRSLRHTLPQNVMLIASPQIVSLMLTEVGNTAGIAEIAALSRFAMVLVVVQQVVGNIGAPLIAKDEVTRLATRRALAIIVGAYLVIVVAFVGVVALLSGPLLSILGPEYVGLDAELVVITAGAGLSSLVTYGLGSVNHARGWTDLSWVYVPFLAVWVVVSLAAFDLTTSLGAAVMYATISLVELSTHLVRLGVGYRRLTS